LSIVFAANSHLRRIDALAFSKSRLRWICLPSTVTELGPQCFRGCQELSFVGFAPKASLRKIAEQCFQFTSLEFIVIPSSVEIIEERAFAKSKLRMICFEDDTRLKRIESQAFCLSEMRQFSIAEMVEYIAPDALHDRGFNEINVHNNNAYFEKTQCFIIESGSSAIRLCEDCNSHALIVDERIRVIGAFSFTTLSHSFEVFFDQDSVLERIDHFAFFKSPIQSIILPRRLQRIEHHAFAESHLIFIDFEPDSCLQVIGSDAFSAVLSLECFEIPKSVETIECRAFNMCAHLRSVSFEDGSSLRMIGNEAFAMSGLVKFTIPAGVTTFGTHLFKGSCSIDCVIFENESALVEMFGNIFGDCSVRMIWFPDNLEVLGRHCLSNCKALECLTFSDSARLKRIDKLAFCGSCLDSFCIPASVNFVHPLAFHQCSITSITVAVNSPYLCIFKGFLATNDGKYLIRYCGDESAIEIPKDVEIVGDYCFAKLEELESVRFEAGAIIKVLGKHAFDSTFITTISIPATVESIKKKCFFRCSALESVIFEAGKYTRCLKCHCEGWD
jgi:hypothetical protein